MLSPEELSDLRADFEALFDKTADIQRNQNLGTPVKGTTPDNWQSILTEPVACAMRQPSASEAAQFSALIASKQSTVISFPDGQDVQRYDHIIIDGTTWTVAASLTPQSYSVATQVLATRLV